MPVDDKKTESTKAQASAALKAGATDAFSSIKEGVKKARTEDLASVQIQTKFYRDSFPKFMFLFVLTLLLCIISISLNILQLIYKPKAQQFATFSSTDGSTRLVEMVPLKEPNLSTQPLLQWATEAATSCYNFDFNRLETQIANLKPYFTAQGYQHYIEALQAENTLVDVKEKLLIVSAVPLKAPVILREAVATSMDKYAWQVQLPLLVTYQSSSELKKSEITVTMLIVRVDTLESPKGIGIAQFLARKGVG
jgi:intracellular multiplication protein IcmL